MKALIAHTENGATAMRGHEYQSMAPIGMAATRVKAPSKMGGSNIGGMAATRKALTMRDDRAVKLLETQPSPIAGIANWPLLSASHFAD